MSNNILIGNGINIQFSDYTYTSDSIIARAMANIKRKKVPEEVFPGEICKWLKLLYNEFPSIMSGDNDEYVYTSDDKVALNNFQKRYSDKKVKFISNIGFEDYFLIHNIFCYKNNIQNPEMYDSREFLRRFFINSIYNEGKILELHEKFPIGLIDFLNSFDEIFTTNYDDNIETALKHKKSVQYLHGAFHILDDVYNPNSARNQLPDVNFEDLGVNPNYMHIYSNALSNATGEDKDYLITAHHKTNSALAKFAEGYQKDPKIKKDIDSWRNSGNQITENLYHGIINRVNNKDYKFTEYYPLKEFKNIKQSLTIFGLSPYNDSHLFKYINDNQELATIVFFYYSAEEIEAVKELLPNKSIEFRSTKEFWNKI